MDNFDDEQKLRHNISACYHTIRKRKLNTALKTMNIAIECNAYCVDELRYFTVSGFGGNSVLAYI